jgi:uncharacterized protein (DUF1800 family)
MSAQTAFDRFRPGTAWQAYFPNGTNPWNAEKVAHLYRRAAFGANWDEIQQGIAGSPRTIVSALLNGGAKHAAFADEAERLAEGAIASGDPQRLKAAWLYRMMFSPHPLQERLTLFWHNHFATSQAKVNDLSLMHRQNTIFREHALERFGPMAEQIAFDPAMLIWLDAETNQQGQPNENLARELFELFTLGVGNYTEEDIKEAARALTGWTLRNGKAEFDVTRHDAGEKTILGQTGRWTAGDVVRIALSQPACSRFLVRKLFREFVSETVEPSEELLVPLVEGYRLRDYDTAWLMETLFSSWVFYSPASIKQKLKSPVDFVVGGARSLEGRASPLKMAEALDRMGQSLFHPPSVKGWDGGTAWINSTTLLARQNLAFALSAAPDNAHNTDPARLAYKYQIQGNVNLVRFFLELFHQNPDHSALPDLVAHLDQEKAGLMKTPFTSPRVADGLLARAAAHLVMTLPDMQLA